MSIPYDTYSSILATINLISQGHTLTAACIIENMSVAVFKRGVANDNTLREMYEEAVHQGNDALADALINIDNHLIHGHSNPQMAKVVSENIKWVLGKRDVARFGERVQIDHSVTVDIAITTALDAARLRVGHAKPIEDAVVLDDEDAEIMRQLLA